MEKIYRNISDPTDSNVYVGDPDVLEIPDNFVEAQLIHHVQKCDKNDSDYDVRLPNGAVTYYRFTSQAGRDTYNSGKLMIKTPNKEATTCPQCLESLGLEDAIIHFSPEEDEGDSSSDEEVMSEDDTDQSTS